MTVEARILIIRTVRAPTGEIMAAPFRAVRNAALRWRQTDPARRRRDAPRDDALACDAEACGHVDQIGERGGLHLPHHLAAVRLHGDLADAELAAHLLVHQAGGH